MPRDNVFFSRPPISTGDGALHWMTGCNTTKKKQESNECLQIASLMTITVDSLSLFHKEKMKMCTGLGGVSERGMGEKILHQHHKSCSKIIEKWPSNCNLV